MADFELRPMEPRDGPAIDELMRSEVPTTAVALTTHYLHDVYQSMLAQNSSLFGVVATSAASDGLVGVATAFTDDVLVDDRPSMAAHLMNLKVHHDVRQQGLGTRLAQWRIDEARRRFGARGGIVTTGIDATNAASLATARHWATQMLGPVRVVIARVSSEPPRLRGLVVRSLDDAEVEVVAAGATKFYDRFQLAPTQTPSTLASILAAPDPQVGAFRHYRVAAMSDATIVAGGMVTERFKLMEDHLDRIPRALELLGRIVPVFPPDRVIKSIEVGLAWHAPGRVDALRDLWDAIRYEWHDRATHVVAQADPRSSLIVGLHVGPTIVPRVQLMIPVQSPDPIDETRPVCLWR
jgi:predicted N-acetyltransferase YhbS